MLLRYATRGFFRSYKVYGSIDGAVQYGSWKSSSRKYYMLRYETRTPSIAVHRKESKRVKLQDKADVDRKVYMKDVVREISNILRYSTWESAREQLHRLHVKWDSYTVNRILKSHPPMEKAWLFFNWASTQKGFKHDQYTCTTMLDIFGEARRISSMKYIFQMMQEKEIKITTVTYTSILHWLSSSGDFEGAVKIWMEMKAKCCHPTVVSYTAYMKVLFDNNRAEEATKLYKEMLQSGLSPTCHTYTILMVHLISSGKSKSALEVFKKMQETGVQPDKAACNILIEHFSKAGEACAIFQILNYMKDNSLVLRYPIYLKAHEFLKRAGEDDTLLRVVNPHITIDVVDESVAFKLEEMAVDVNAKIDRGLLISFLRKKNFVAVEHLFTELVNHNKVLNPDLISEIIEASCDNGRTDAALMVFEYSKNMGVHIDQVAYLSLMGVLFRTNEFSKILQIVEQMVNFGLFLESPFASSLILRVGQAKEHRIAVKLFDLLPKEVKSASVYTALIDACFSAGAPDKGIDTFNTMKRTGVQATLGTYNVVIRGLQMCSRGDQAEFYRREKRSLEKTDYFARTMLTDEKICDTLFAGYMVY